MFDCDFQLSPGWKIFKHAMFLSFVLGSKSVESTVFHLEEHGDLHPKPVLSESGGLSWWPGIGFLKGNLWVGGIDGIRYESDRISGFNMVLMISSLPSLSYISNWVGPESWIFLPESRCNTCSSWVAVKSNAFHICWFDFLIVLFKCCLDIWCTWLDMCL